MQKKETEHKYIRGSVEFSIKEFLSFLSLTETPTLITILSDNDFLAIRPETNNKLIVCYNYDD